MCTLGVYVLCTMPFIYSTSQLSPGPLKMALSHKRNSVFEMYEKKRLENQEQNVFRRFFRAMVDSALMPPPPSFYSTGRLKYSMLIGEILKDYC